MKVHPHEFCRVQWEGAITAKGPLDVSGVIKSTSGGFEFPDGTVQETAVVDALWQASGSDLYYDSGDVGLGTSTPKARLDVSAHTGEPSIVTRGGNDYATVTGQEIDFGHWNGTTFTERMAIDSNGDVEIGGDVSIGTVGAGVQLLVQNDNVAKPVIFQVLSSDGTSRFRIREDGSLNVAKISTSPEGDLTLTGGAAPTVVLDHPLDPAQKQLRFTAVEGPERYTFHSGTVVLDGSGAATVTLPDWYEASNTDLRYQLTPIGAPGPNLYIAREVQNNRFEIAGGTAGMKVSWQLTATRADAAARARPFEAESLKAAADRGRYYTPEAHGQPLSLRINPGQDVDNQQPFEN